MGRTTARRSPVVRLGAAEKRHGRSSSASVARPTTRSRSRSASPNRGGAYRAVSQALRDIPREAADELRQVELERFDAIQIRLMQKLGQGDLTVVPNLLRLLSSGPGSSD
jgi:hypothetical protein